MYLFLEILFIPEELSKGNSKYAFVFVFVSLVILLIKNLFEFLGVKN